MPDYEIIHCVVLKGTILPVRFVNALKHIFGYRSCYGDFDSYELTNKDVPSLSDNIGDLVPPVALFWYR